MSSAIVWRIAIRSTGRAVSNSATLLGVFGNLPKYFRILRQLDAIVAETQPDVILNFFEPMAAFYALTRFRRPPVVAIGHQFMFQHPGYVRAPQLWKQLLSMKIYTRLLGARAGVGHAIGLFPNEPLVFKSLAHAGRAARKF